MCAKPTSASRSQLALRFCTSSFTMIARGIVVALALITPAMAEERRDLDARLDAMISKEPARIPEIIANGWPTLLVFTDHHCAACLSMVPIVERLTQKYTGRANVITIDPQDPHLAVRLLSAKYGVWGTPMMVLLDRTAIVRKKLYGPQLERTLAGDLDRLLRTAR